MNLAPINTTRKSGQKRFKSKSVELDVNLLDFWQWANADLLNNASRGVLAEFLVATDLGVNQGTRTEWDAYDISDNDGTRIEVGGNHKKSKKFIPQNK